MKGLAQGAKIKIVGQCMAFCEAFQLVQTGIKGLPLNTFLDFWLDMEFPENDLTNNLPSKSFEVLVEW